MIRKFLSNLAFTVTLVLAGVMLVPAALGMHHYVILTGSMTGTYDAGSIVYDKTVPTASLNVGDPITYAPPPGASPNHALVTHRIYSIRTGRDGKRVYRTKGDNNPHPDPWLFMLPQQTQDRVVFHIPYLGFAFMMLSIQLVREVLIGIPALGLALWFVLSMWREAGEIERRREDAIRPWAADVARSLPLLMPLVDGDPAAGRATVRVPMSWTAAVRDPPRTPIAEGASAWALYRTRALAGTGARDVRGSALGRIRLPAGCIARDRDAVRPDGPVRTLPDDWRLVVRPATAPELVAA